MRACSLLGLASALIFAAAAQAAPMGPPLTPAADGRMQCYAPDTARKTCQSMAVYRRGEKGGIDNIAIVLISRSPAITMRTVSSVELKNGQVCGLVQLDDLQKAVFTIDGQPADADQTAQLRQQLAAAMKDVVGKEVCTAYIPAGAGFTAKATIAGVAQSSDSDQTVIWVSPADGYKVAP